MDDNGKTLAEAQRHSFNYEFHHTTSPEIRWTRITDSVALAAGIGTIELPDIPVGYHAYYYRVVVGGSGIGGATVALFANSDNGANLLDWGTVVALGLGEVFAPSKPYQIDPGSNLTVTVTGGGAGEATVNAYYRLVQHVEGRERIPLPSRNFTVDEQAIDAPAQGIVDFYPAHSTEIPRSAPGAWQDPAEPNEGYTYGGPKEDDGRMANS